jgi:GAF domain-containing protein
MSAPIPANETERLKALYWYEIMDTEAEEIFDDLALAASKTCQTPIALISLVDEKRQWFKARVGLAATETPRDVSFCAHAMLQTDVFEVKDALQDHRFVNNPLVLSAPKIRFYAGAPLKSEEGYGLGSLCVIDYVPRQLTPDQKEALQALSRVVAGLLKQRRLLAEIMAEVS